MQVIHRHSGDKPFDKNSEAPLGWIFLGRDVKSWGEEGTGRITVDPDKECEIACPHYNAGPSDTDTTPIHFSIASFRDRLCPRTLFNLFQKAKFPHRIFVRLIQQREYDSPDIDDADCWKQFCTHYKEQMDCNIYRDQVQVMTMNAQKAKGPTDPRSKLSAMLLHDYQHRADGQAKLHPVEANHFCMQTDSHMDFSHDYDVRLIQMFDRAKNDYAVLTTYVAPMEQTDTDPTNVPHLCMVQFTATWRNWGTKFCESIVRPKLTNVVWGAGLSFEKCHADLNVPYDPFLPNMFDGEEISRAFRFFTHGYDMYTPDQVLVTHDYQGHQHNPHVHTWGGSHGIVFHVGQDEDSDFSWCMKEIEDLRPTLRPQGMSRINTMLGIKEASDDVLLDMINLSRFGLGNRRTLQQAIEFSGFDPKQRKMVANHCGNLAWVPFEEHNNNYGLDFNINRPLWPTLEEIQELKKSGHHKGKALDKQKPSPVTADVILPHPSVPPHLSSLGKSEKQQHSFMDSTWMYGAIILFVLLGIVVHNATMGSSGRQRRNASSFQRLLGKPRKTQRMVV